MNSWPCHHILSQRAGMIRSANSWGELGPNGFIIFVSSDLYCWGSCGLADTYQVNYIQHKYESIDNANVYNIDMPDRRGAYNDDAWIAWLDRADVQAAFHTPKVEFLRCNKDLQFVASTQVQPPAYRIFPDILSKGIKVNIFGGDLDFILPNMGALVDIQNMTWNQPGDPKKQGLTRPPGQVKLHGIDGKTTKRKGNVVGKYTEERGISFSTFKFAGHRVAQDDPDAALDWLKKVVL